MTRRKLINVPLAGSAQPKAHSNEVSAKKTTNPPNTVATACARPQQISRSPNSDSQDTIRAAPASAPAPAQSAKRRRLLLFSKHAEPQPAASTTTPSKPAKQERAKAALSTSASKCPGSLPKSPEQSAAVQKVSQNGSTDTPAADSQPITVMPTSSLQPARPPAQHAAQSLSGVRDKSNSPSTTAAAATVTPPGKSLQPPEKRLVTPTPTPKPGSSATPAIQADSNSREAETGLRPDCDSSATSTPVQLAASPAKGLASRHGSVALLPQGRPAEKQTGKPSDHSASALLRMLRADLPATCTANATPDGKAAATNSQVQPSMQEGVKLGNSDTLLMVRRLPAVLTGTLPTLESLGVQVSLPSGATLLKQLPKKPQGSRAGRVHMRQLCHPGIVRDVQSWLVPKACHSEIRVRGSCNQIIEDAAAFVMEGMQDSRLQEILSRLTKDDGLTLKMPAVVAGSRKSPPANVPSLKPVYDEDAGHNLGLDMAAASGGSKHASACQDKDVAAAVSDAEASVQSLILKQQTEFADIWSSPEKQAEECMAFDAFPVVLSFLQAVLS